MLKTIDHINIVVSDLEQSVAFFEQLGFQKEDQAKLSGQWIAAIVGYDNVEAEYAKLHLPGTPTRLELIKYYTPPSEADPQMHEANQLGFRHMAFEVDDIDAVTKRLKDNGTKLVGEIATYPKTGKRLVYFYGPDNILLELAQY